MLERRLLLPMAACLRRQVYSVHNLHANEHNRLLVCQLQHCR